MGTDIHWILEQQHPDGAWHAVSDDAHDRVRAPIPEIHWRSCLAARDYALFALLSGVRGPTLPQGPIAQPGWPEDVSAYALQERRLWGKDGHTLGQLTSAGLGAGTLAAAARLDDASWRTLYAAHVAARGLQYPQAAPPAAPQLGRWRDRLAAAAASADGAPALPPRPDRTHVSGVWDGRFLCGWTPATPDPDAIARGQEARGGPWRLLILYDN